MSMCSPRTSGISTDDRVFAKHISKWNAYAEGHIAEDSVTESTRL